MSPLTWDDLTGTKVGIFGFGSEGQAALRACIARGISPVVVDDRDDFPPMTGIDVKGTERGGLEELMRCDVVIKTPGISRYDVPVAALRASGVRVVGALALWLAGHPYRERVLCITGTKGKSTTTHIAGKLLSGLGYRVFVGGNLGTAPFDPGAHADDADYWVIEVSSYQAADMEVSPPVVAVTSLHPDHLPWHGGDVETYYRDKLRLCSRPGAQVTVVNGDSEVVRDHSAQLGPRVTWVTAPQPGDPDWGWIEPMNLLGEHNRRNARIAATALREMGIPAADDPVAMAVAASGFIPLPNRLQHVGDVDGVDFVDDGLSTNVLPTLAALDAFPDQPVALIVGGLDRGIDYTELGRGLRARTAPVLMLTIPDSGARIAREVTAAAPGPLVEVQQTATLEEAVRTGFVWVRDQRLLVSPGRGVVLLSPAAPSFGRYRNYKDRSAAFVEVIGRLR